MCATAFLLAILVQESRAQKTFDEPGERSGQLHHPRSGQRNGRGLYHYLPGLWCRCEYTLFHHPPTAAEVSDFMLDVEKNVERARSELRDKFDHFVLSASAAAQADDRIAEDDKVPCDPQAPGRRSPFPGRLPGSRCRCGHSGHRRRAYPAVRLNGNIPANRPAHAFMKYAVSRSVGLSSAIGPTPSVATTGAEWTLSVSSPSLDKSDETVDSGARSAGKLLRVAPDKGRRPFS